MKSPPTTGKTDHLGSVNDDRVSLTNGSIVVHCVTCGAQLVLDEQSLRPDERTYECPHRQWYHVFTMRHPSEEFTLIARGWVRDGYYMAMTGWSPKE